VTLAQAEAGLQPWFQRMLEADTRREGWPRVSDDERSRFLASHLQLLAASRGRFDLRGRFERPLWVLMAATTLVLLLACLNVANLSLARGYAQRREMGVRAVIGATTWRIAKERLAQNAWLALGGGLAGVAAAPALVWALAPFLPSAAHLDPVLNLRLLGFSLLLTVATLLASGVIPAIRAARTTPMLALKEHSGTVAAGMGLRKTLVIGQVALAAVLLIGAGLFLRTLASLRAQGPGFDTSRLLTFAVAPIRNGSTPAEAKGVMTRLLSAVQALPEVESAAVGKAQLMGGGSWNQRLTIVDSTRRVTADVVHCNAVTPGFFRTLGTTLASGRDFDAGDVHDRIDGRPRVAIVNEAFATRHLAGRAALGVHVGLGVDGGTLADIEVVGVVRNFHYRGLREESEEQAFFPALEGPLTGGIYYVRTHAEPTAAFASIRAAARAVDGRLPVRGLRTMDSQLDALLLTERMLATLSVAFALVATLLAVLGLYGVMSFVVAYRTREIGIRLALGATPRSTVRAITGDAAALVAAGLAIALPVSWALGRLVSSQLFGVDPADAATLVGASGLVACVSVAASLVPARRASRLNAVDALRAE
jgi:predicted permease